MLIVTMLAFGVAAGGACLHGHDETAEQAQRRQKALQAVHHVNTVEHMGIEKAKRFVPLGHVPGVPAAEGFTLSLVTDSRTYMLSAKDTRDACGFAYFSDETGLIYEAQPIRK